MLVRCYWCCFSHINSHNQVRDHRTGSSHSGVEYACVRVYNIPGGASPRRTTARLGSAHAPNFRGCMAYIMRIGLQANRGCTWDSPAKGCIHINRVWIKEKQTLESGAKKHSNKLRHPADDDEQQRQQRPNNFYVHVIMSTTVSGSCCSSTTASSICSINNMHINCAQCTYRTILISYLD